MVMTTKEIAEFVVELLKNTRSSAYVNADFINKKLIEENDNYQRRKLQRKNIQITRDL